MNHASPFRASTSDAAALPAPRVDALRPSACPGLLRIVSARDGGLCRIKLPGGVLRADQAAAIADASERHAAGVIDVTNRANLQLRGVRAGHEAALIDALVHAGLGPDAGANAGVNAGANADDVRNVLVSPTAGRDPDALIDTTELTAQLLALLQNEPRFAALSPKFALLLDGGERLARIDHPHDIWLAAIVGEDGVRFAFGLAGCPPSDDARSDANSGHMHRLRAAASADDVDANGVVSVNKDAAASITAPEASPATSPALACVTPSQVPALVSALLHTFIDLAAADATRMRHLLAACPVDTILQHAQTYTGFPLTRMASLAQWRRAPTDASLRLGVHPQRNEGTCHAGGQPPLGRLDASALQRLAALAQKHGNGTLRMTPWQSVLLPDVAAHAAPTVLAELASFGLACDPADTLSHLIACAGSPGCAKSHADTKADAVELAARLPGGGRWRDQVHLSGCPRSCAAAHRAPYTLLAAAPGHYDLYRRDATPGFGVCVAHHLTIEQAADALARLARSPLDA